MAAVRCARLCRTRSIDIVQRVNGANKANKAYAECFKFGMGNWSEGSPVGRVIGQKSYG